MNVENIIPMSVPPPAPRSREYPHVTVLREEVTSGTAPRDGGTYVDVTLGAGGHAQAILEVPGTRLIGFDRDANALAIANARLATYGGRARVQHGTFRDLAANLALLGIEKVDGLIADLGVSSMQIDEAERGMSFRMEGPLDMRMDTDSGETALDIIDRLDDDELADLIYKYGEERRSRRVARCIKQARENGELTTTLDLRRAVVRAVGPAKIGGVDPATRTFQAFRIAVNDELGELEALLAGIRDVVAVGGTVAIISFHSLEDRLVKRALRDRAAWQPTTKKPIVPSEEEQRDNPRSRSAKLRVATRIEGEPVSGPFEGEETYS
jgi:16S rRNA (cytosine1402-N4)-methyltransferase